MMAHLKEMGNPYHEFYGVARKPLTIPDFYHIDNIAINTASIIFSGDIERGGGDEFFFQVQEIVPDWFCCRAQMRHQDPVQALFVTMHWRHSRQQ